MSGFPAGPDNAMQTGDLPRADRNVRRLQMSRRTSLNWLLLSFCSFACPMREPIVSRRPTDVTTQPVCDTRLRCGCRQDR
jgi:hypothetical protein